MMPISDRPTDGVRHRIDGLENETQTLQCNENVRHRIDGLEIASHPIAIF